ncbi:MAG: LCP family protein [Clostridia bacterium]|nr:LCP family protein [Clostridia bacterium]
MMNRRKQPRFAADSKRSVLVAGLVFLLIVSIVVGVYVVGRRVELNVGGDGIERGDLTGRFAEPRIVAYNGQNYRYRSDLTTILFIGVDRTTEEYENVTGFRDGGMADFLLLQVIDPKKESITAIQLDRDTMTEITILGVLGNPAGTRTYQLCIAHGFGDGGELSSQLTADAVSKHLHGVDIDFYVTMRMSGITVLNDTLGGVTVTLQDDFTALDPDMRAGETLTLRGMQARYYVQNRLEIGEGTNVSRMVRQKEFMWQAGVLLNEKLRENVNFVGTLLDALSDDLLTNMSRGRMINEANGARNYCRAETITPRGEHTVGDDGYIQFHADARALEELVLEIFFELEML